MLSPIATHLAASIASPHGFAVYGGTEPEGFAEARAYRFYRVDCGEPAAEALRLAREAKAAGRRVPYPTRGAASYQNKPNDRGGRWIERPDLAGLRFVGFADKLASRIRHTGWFLYPEGDPADVTRGAVYQLPSRDGRPVYVEGHVTGESTRDGFREQSTGGRDESRFAAVIYLGSLHYGERGGDQYRSTDDCESAVRDAAYGADREAEVYAEAEREYQEAWQLGQQAAQAVEEAAGLRETVRRNLAEMRGLAINAPSDQRATLRGCIRRDLAAARELYSTAAALWREHGEPVTWRPELADAFAEGASAATYWESRK